MLALSFSGFDPFRTLGSRTLAELFVPRPRRSFGWAWDRVVFFELLFETGRADVPFEVDGQRGMPSAGIALSIKPTVLFRRSLTEHSPCARRLLREMLILRQRGSAMKPKLGTFVTALLAGT